MGTCIFMHTSVSLVGVPLLSADVGVAMVRLAASEVEQGPIGKLSSKRTRSCNSPEIALFVPKASFASEWLILSAMF